jgi:hypothetical protein
MTYKDPDELAHEAGYKRFVEALGEFLEGWYPGVLAPHPGDGLDDEEREGMGTTYLSGWVLVVSSSSLDPDPAAKVSHTTSKYYPDLQNPFLGIGLLADAYHRWASA